MGRTRTENMMAKYLLLKHYRGGPAPAVDWAPMDHWTPDEVDAHVQFMRDFAARLEETGEFVDTQALAPNGAFVRYDGEGRPRVTDGPFVETKDLIAGRPSSTPPCPVTPPPRRTCTSVSVTQ
jgi:hypothetical protein